MDFTCSSAGKELTCNEEDLGSIPGLRRSLGEGKGYPLQYSSLENSMDCIVHGVAKSRTRLSDFHFYFSLCIQTQDSTQPPVWQHHFKHVAINSMTLPHILIWENVGDILVSWGDLQTGLNSLEIHSQTYSGWVVCILNSPCVFNFTGTFQILSPMSEGYFESVGIWKKAYIYLFTLHFGF